MFCAGRLLWTLLFEGLLWTGYETVQLPLDMLTADRYVSLSLSIPAIIIHCNVHIWFRDVALCD